MNDNSPLNAHLANLLLVVFVWHWMEALVGVDAVLPYPVFQIPVNDQPECADYSTDCLERSGLCRNEVFKDIMRQRCPKTCRICGEVLKETEDFVAQATDSPTRRYMGNGGGRSNNPNKEWLTKTYAYNVDHDEFNQPGYTNAVDSAAIDVDAEYGGANSDEYLSLSSEHRTSTIMPPSAILQPPISRPTPSPPSIADRNVPAIPYHRRRTCLDHAPNCFYLKSLCFNRFYLPIMQKSCRRSCGFCQHSKPTARNRAKWTSVRPRSHPWHGNLAPADQEYGVCRNRGLDCDEKIKWCSHWRYWKFMRRICAASCGFCDVAENEY